MAMSELALVSRSDVLAQNEYMKVHVQLHFCFYARLENCLAAGHWKVAI